MTTEFLKVPKKLRLRRLTRLRMILGLVVSCVALWLVTVTPIALSQSPHPPTPNPAPTPNSLESLQLQQQQIDATRQRLAQERDRLTQLETKAKGQLKGLQQNLIIKTGQIQEQETRLSQEVKRLTDLEATLTKTEATYRQKQSSIVARLQFLQRQRLDRGWAVLLQSQTLNEFFDRRFQLSRMYDRDRRALVALKTETDRLNQQRDTVERQRNDIALLTQQLQSQKRQFQSAADSQKLLIDRLKTDTRAMEAAAQQLTRDSQKVGSLIQQRIAANSQVVLRGNGRMQFPTNGEITSLFGWREHPILGYGRLHTGMDFGADEGTPIYASDRGMIVFAGWFGGYGNTVVVDHGGNLATLYAHASEIYVQEGQMVQRGQPIAAIGSTGFSTGPHLHFEVRQSGEPIDPANYL